MHYAHVSDEQNYSNPRSNDKTTTYNDKFISSRVLALSPGSYYVTITRIHFRWPNNHVRRPTVGNIVDPKTLTVSSRQLPVGKSLILQHVDIFLSCSCSQHNAVVLVPRNLYPLSNPKQICGPCCLNAHFSVNSYPLAILMS
jgi:hypothetical protein